MLQIGYLAEDGGIIPQQMVIIPTENLVVLLMVEMQQKYLIPSLNNRTGEAIVAAAYAGEVSDFILAYEYAHSGAEYSVATSDIVRAGANASVIHEEFRDGGLSASKISK